MVTVVRLISPQVWVDRQIKGVQATAMTNYATGIDSPKKDPIQAAIASKQAWANQVQLAIQNDLFAKGLQNVTIQDWNSQAKNLGVQRLVPGIMAKQAKIQAFVTSFSPLLTNLLSSIDQMPTGTSAERTAKSTAMQDGLRALRGQW